MSLGIPINQNVEKMTNHINTNGSFCNADSNYVETHLTWIASTSFKRIILPKTSHVTTFVPIEIRRRWRFSQTITEKTLFWLNKKAFGSFFRRHNHQACQESVSFTQCVDRRSEASHMAGTYLGYNAITLLFKQVTSTNLKIWGS